MQKIICVIIFFLFTSVNFSQNFAGLPSIFSDNMVLQQKSGVPFWGKSKIDGELVITAGWGETAKIKITKDAAWSVKIKTPKAGGPYNIKVQLGDSVLVYKNVLVGEVWVCSGQSNMEMPLEGWPPKDTISCSYETIKNSSNPKLRLFSVVKSFADKKLDNCSGSWVESNPETSAKFSATAYFFGKKLQDELKIPIGLINTSWGGTPIESWISADYLKEMSDYKPVLEKISESGKEINELLDWLNKHEIIDVSAKTGDEKWENLNLKDSVCSQEGYDDSRWPAMNLPAAWESTGMGEFDGVIWFRRNIEIPEKFLNKDLVLQLGPIDDMDRTFVNGVMVGINEKGGLWQLDRVYEVPKVIIKGNKLTIAVRVIDNQGGGGIYGMSDRMVIYPKGENEKISISGEWKYLPVAEFRGNKFFVMDAIGEEFFKRPKLNVNLSAYTPTALFNAMINPLVPYGIKGAIWFQGEANTGKPETYSSLMKMMITNWRDAWQQKDFPFYYTQLTPYNYGSQTHSEKLREAQLKTMTFKNTGMAVTLDIGNPENIHADNKKDVGARLAYWALAKDYGKKIPFSGPIYKSMKVIKGKIEISFAYADKGLKLKPVNGKLNFAIAGKDKVFKEAKAEAAGNKLVVYSPEVKEPVSVRYAWSNTAEGTLFNGCGLPASSFRTDNWDE